jgi:MoaA/NifB/PqqE/SkfB family radical SAM enzyme
MLPYLQNLFKLAWRERTLDPLVAVYYVTTQCNLNCAYCEDFGARRNPQAEPFPSLDVVRKILSVIRSGVPRLWLTGGEPFLAPHLPDLLRIAKSELRFREVTLISNGTLLSQHFETLKYLDRLVISLDSVNEGSLDLINLTPLPVGDVLSSIERAAVLQKSAKFKLIVNAVLTPETVSGFDDLLAFCTQNKILLSVSPQSFNNWPRYELLVSEEYRALLDRIIHLKKRGAPILGSTAYLNTMLDLQPYACYPTLTPRILPDGWLLYPCRPMEKDEGEQGGRAVNLQEVSSWEAAWNIAQLTYGDAPAACGSCFQQCYAEPSLMQSKPLAFLWERLRYVPSRKVNLSTYAPG